MRCLIGVVLFMLLAAAAPAQEARLSLKDGRTVQGVLIAVEDDYVQVRVHGEVVTVPLDSIVDFEEVEAGTRPPPDPDEETAPPATGPGPSGATPRPVTLRYSDPDPSGTLFGRRLGWIPNRYAWIPTDDTKTIVSVTLVFFLLLAGALHFSTRVTSMDSPSVQRCMLLSFLVLSAAAVQIGFVETTPLAVLIMLVGNVVGWVVITRTLFDASLMNMLAMAVATMLCALLSLVLLEMVDGILALIAEGAERSWGT